ncbi:MAG: BatD family protein [Salinivirgaceae bacterium]|jgi:hypothetical protein|nr:BatD family protein [Salinivirgaceae bacterium]
MEIINRIRCLWLLLIFIGSSSFAFGQVKFKASAPRVVEMGEQFRISYTLNQKGRDFQSPNFGEFRILSGPNVSSSSSVQIVNGNMTQSVSYTYNFVAMALAEGKHTISAAAVKVKNKEYKSNAISIEVVKGNAGAKNVGGTETSTVDNTNSKNKGLFVSVNVNKKTLYQGESLVAEIKVYTQKSLSGFEDIKLPPFTGFWSQDIESPQQIQLHRENVNGQIYEVGLFKKVLLFPQRFGDVVIDPFEITMITQERVRSSSPFDDFFGGSVRRVPYKLASKAVNIKVKPLPANKPSDFNGAVGQFTLSANVDNTKVKANEAINLKIKISGNGNLKLIKPLKVDFPPDIDVYDPKTSLNSKASTAGVNGNISFDYLFIPRYAGTYRIAPITFSYFDTSTKTYKTLSSKDFEISVEKGSGDAEMTSGIVQGLTKEDVKYIGKDIRFLKTNFQLSKIEKPIYGSWWFYLVYGSALLLFIMIVLLRRAQIQQNANQAKVKNRKANKVSQKRLKKASGFMKQAEDEKFYDEVLRAIWGYLSDKLVIPVANLSKDNVTEILENRKVESESILSLMQLLDACEFARYAPASVSGGMDDIFKKTVSLISKLDQNIK